MYKDHTEKAQYGWKAIAVPGEVHGLWTAFNTFGSGALSWKELIQPTIDLMKSGK
jgi:gamma-glutamyltranspeptidase